MWSGNPTSGYVSKGNEISTEKTYLFSNVHDSIFHNSYDSKTTYMSIYRWMDKENVVYTYNEILFGLIKT